MQASHINKAVDNPLDIFTNHLWSC